jgi:hypothetical protein
MSRLDLKKNLAITAINTRYYYILISHLKGMLSPVTPIINSGPEHTKTAITG